MKINTLIIGAGRSGTTSLYKLLENHPQVCFSKIKEVHFFSIDDLYQRGEKYYHSFFTHYKNQPIVACADTFLMIDYDAISRIKAYNPDMKIIVMLRNPVDRAYSSYLYSVNYGYHKPYNSFLNSLKYENEIYKEANIIQRNNIGHFYAGLYAKHLSEWVKEFPKTQILLLKTRDLKSKPVVLKEKITQFLGIQSFDIDDTSNENHNPHAVAKFKAFEQFLLNRDNTIRKFIRWVFPEFLKRLIIHSSIVDRMHNINRKSAEYEPLSVEMHQQAMKYFENDMQLLKNEFDLEL